MFFPMVLLTVLFAAGMPSAIRETSCNATGVSTSIENLDQLVGTIKVLYVYDQNINIPVPICLDGEISKPTILDIVGYVVTCGIQ